MRRFLSFLLILCLSFSLAFNAFAESKQKEEQSQSQDEAEDKSSDEDGSKTIAYKLDDLSGAPSINAVSGVLMDAETGAVLFSQEGKTKRYPASITKVMTALLAIENCDLDETVEYTAEVVNSIEAGSSSAGIGAGAKLTMEETLYALMLFSANEAAAAIAHHISGSDAKFAKLMTKRAKELGCKGTQFKNPHGLPDEEHYTTAYDMALILKKAMEYEDFRRIAGTLTYTIENDTLPAPIELYNHAKIMHKSSEFYYEYVEGAKTGFTQVAGNTLVTYAKKGDVELICTVLKEFNTDDGVKGAWHSYYDSKALYNWGFDKVKKIKPLEDYDLVDSIKEDYASDEKLIEKAQFLNCSFDKDLTLLVPKSFKSSSLDLSFRKDQDEDAGRFGYIDVEDGDKTITSVPVTYDSSLYADDGSSIDDDLQSADVDAGRITPKKILHYLIRIVIAILAIFLIMRLISGIIIRRKRRRRPPAGRHRKRRN